MIGQLQLTVMYRASCSCSAVTADGAAVPAAAVGRLLTRSSTDAIPEAPSSPCCACPAGATLVKHS